MSLKVRTTIASLNALRSPRGEGQAHRTENLARGFRSAAPQVANARRDQISPDETAKLEGLLSRLKVLAERRDEEVRDSQTLPASRRGYLELVKEVNHFGAAPNPPASRDRLAQIDQTLMGLEPRGPSQTKGSHRLQALQDLSVQATNRLAARTKAEDLDFAHEAARLLGQASVSQNGIVSSSEFPGISEVALTLLR